MKRMRLLLALCGVSAATMRKYVIVFPLGTALFSMNLMVSVPVGISGWIPVASRPISSAAACSHSAPSELRRSSRYSASLPVSGWTALLQYWGSRKPSLVQSKVGCSPSLMVSVVSALSISVAISCVCCVEREKCSAEERVWC